MNVYLCFVVCLHFSIGCYYRLQCFWILEQCPVPPSSDLSCSASALMLRSQTTSSRSSDSLKWAPALPGLHLESKTYFELIDTFGHVPCFSAGAPFVVQAFVLCPLRNSGGARIALVRFALLNSVNFRRALRTVLLEQAGFQKRFLKYPEHSACQAAIENRGDVSGTRSHQWLAGNVGRSRAARCPRIVKILFCES